MKILQKLEITLEYHQGIAFSHWLPVGDENNIIINEDNLTLTISFDEKCSSLSHHLENIEDIQRWHQIDIMKAKFTIEYNNIEETFAHFVYNKLSSQENASVAADNKEEKEYSQRYERLAEKAITLSTKYFNRLINYFRVYQRQYWLIPIDEELNQFNIVDGSGSIGNVIDNRIIGYRLVGNTPEINDKWFNWRRDGRNIVSIVRPVDTDSKEVRQEQSVEHWKHAREFVLDNKQASFTLELLSSAKKLFSEKEYRHSVIETCMSMEIAIVDFSQRPDFTKLDIAENDHSRKKIISLTNIFKEFGLTKTLSLILPILFSTKEMPTETIFLCQNCAELRNNIIHNRKRTFSDSEIRNINNYINAAYCLTGVLMDYTSRSRMEVQTSVDVS